MDLLGLSATQLAALFAVAGGAVVVLYILKLRRRQVPVPFSRLWDRLLIDRPTSSLFSQLKRLLSLLVQLLLLGLLVLALGDPRLRGAASSGRTLVVLLDGSASMKATDVPGGREGAARDAVRAMIRAMGSGDRMLLAQMDAEVTALSPMTDDAGPLEAALREYRARDTGTDFPRALRFALDALRGAARPEVVVVGDGGYGEARDASGAVTPGRVPVRFVPVGRSGRNVGIAAFAVRRYPLDKSRYEVLVEVRSYSDRAEQVELTLTADGAPLEVTRLALEAGGVAQRILSDMSGANESLEARLAFADGSHDDLPADDRAFATLPARRRARILAVTAGNRYLEAALLLDEYLDVLDATPAEAPARLRAEHFDVVILDGVTMPVPPGTQVFYIRPEGQDSPLPADTGFVLAPRGGALGFEHVETRHPLVRWASDLEETHIGRIVRYRPLPGDRVLGSCSAGPLLISGERRGDRFVALAFDVRESDLPLLVSWPVLLVNAVDWFAGEDPAYLSSFKTGETWRIPVPAGTDRARIETPAGRALTVPVLEGRAVFLGAQAGLYRLRAGEERVLVAGNLADPDESRCAPRRTLEVGGTRATAPSPGRAGVRRELWLYLLAGAIAILMLEWASYHRRVTV